MRKLIFMIGLVSMSISPSVWAGWGWFGSSTEEKKAAISSEEGLKESLNAFNNKDYSTALAGIEVHAKAGDRRALTALGVMYGNGFGVPKDLAKAAELFRQAAEKGESAGQTNLALWLMNGMGVKKNPKEAVRWVQKAADQGFPGAQYRLGNWYWSGLGLPQSYSKAAFWMKKAALQGDAYAKTDIGTLYEYGYIPKSDKQAEAWYKETQEQKKVAAAQAKEEKKAKRAGELVCTCQVAQDFVQSQIDRENEVGRVAGVVDKVKLHNLGLQLVSIKEFLSSAGGGRTIASDCSAKAIPATYEKCMDAVADHAVKNAYGE